MYLYVSKFYDFSLIHLTDSVLDDVTPFVLTPCTKVCNSNHRFILENSIKVWSLTKFVVWKDKGVQSVSTILLKPVRRVSENEVT